MTYSSYLMLKLLLLDPANPRTFSRNKERSVKSGETLCVFYKSNKSWDDLQIKVVILAIKILD